MLFWVFGGQVFDVIQPAKSAVLCPAEEDEGQHADGDGGSHQPEVQPQERNHLLFVEERVRRSGDGVTEESRSCHRLSRRSQ